MSDSKKENRKEKALRFELERILEKIKDIHKTLVVLNSYCHSNLMYEQIYNISGMMKKMENQLDIVIEDICRILNSSDISLPDFISNIVPLDKSDVFIDD